MQLTLSAAIIFLVSWSITSCHNLHSVAKRRVLKLAAVKSVSASEQQNINSFSMMMALLVSSGITWHVLQHVAMSYWQHSFTGPGLRSTQHVEQPLIASNNKLVTSTAGCCSLKASIESLSTPVQHLINSHCASTALESRKETIRGP